MDYIKQPYERKVWDDVPDPSEYDGDLNSLPRFDALNMNRIEDGIEELYNHGLGEYCSTSTGDKTFKESMQKGCGFYTVATDKDAPYAQKTWLSLLQIARANDVNNETGAQLAFDDWNVSNPRMWMRTLFKGNVSSWVEMLHTGNIAEHTPVIRSGLYTGDGEETRTINLGYTPDVVILFSRSGFAGAKNDVSGYDCYGGMAFKNQPLGVADAIGLEIVNNGFKIAYTKRNTNLGNAPKTNKEFMVYYYLTITNVALQNGEII